MLLRLYNKNNNPKDLEEVIRVLEEGGLIIYPTDTMRVGKEEEAALQWAIAERLREKKSKN